MQNSSERLIRVYLDQNVLDFLVKERLTSVEQSLQDRDKYQVVYSHVTLDEISRISDSNERNVFFDYLERIGAVYFQVESDEKGCFIDRAPADLYEELHQEDPETQAVLHSLEQFLYKMAGGRQGEGLGSVMQEGEDAFAALLKTLDQSAKELGFDEKSLGMYLADLHARHETATKGIIDAFEKNFPDTNELDTIKLFRDFTSLGPLQLNNIEPPNVIPKVWEKIKDSRAIDLDNVSIEMLFGEGLWNYWGDRVSLIQKINGVYHMLNLMGYHSDPKMNRERNFISLLSDQSHAGYAAYANVVLSRDKRFVRKTEAVYEYLGISTEVIFVPTAK